LFTVAAVIAVSESFGFIKALRELGSCSPKALNADPISNTIFITVLIPSIKDLESHLACLSNIQGSARLSVRAKPRSVEVCSEYKLKQLGFQIIPRGVGGRFIAFKPCERIGIVVEKPLDGKWCVFHMASTKRLSIPIPPTLLSLVVELPKDFKNFIELVKEFAHGLSMAGLADDTQSSDF